MYGIIYKVTNELSGKVYIGQTIYTLAHRKAGHKIQALKGDRRYAFGIAILEYGFDNFQWEQIDTAETKEELDQKEKQWIVHYKSNDPAHGYNHTDGGEKTVYSPEARKKISEALKGKKRSEEIRKKFSEIRKGKYTGEKNSFFGKKHSTQTRQKQSEVKKGKKRGEKNPSVTITEEVARQIKTALAAGERICNLARKYGVTISLVKNIKYGTAWAWLQISS